MNVTGKQLLIAAGVGSVALYLLSRQAAKLNPANPDNYVNAALTSQLGGGDRTKGQAVINSALGPLFAYYDLINPFISPERKRFARSVLFGRE